jgi:hypothetical protein
VQQKNIDIGNEFTKDTKKIRLKYEDNFNRKVTCCSSK